MADHDPALVDEMVRAIDAMSDATAEAFDAQVVTLPDLGRILVFPPGTSVDLVVQFVVERFSQDLSHMIRRVQSARDAVGCVQGKPGATAAPKTPQ